MSLKILSSSQFQFFSDSGQSVSKTVSGTKSKSSATSLYRQARQLEQIHDREASEIIYRTLIKDHPDTPQADRARRRLEVLAGRGSWVDRVEHSVPVFMTEMLSPGSMGPMMVSGLGFRLTRLGLGSWMTHRGSWSSMVGQFGVRGLSSLGALGAEGMGFSTAHRFSAAALGQTVDWSGSAWLKDCSHSWLMMGGMRFVGSAAQGLYSLGHRVSSVTGKVERWSALAPVSRRLATEGGAVGGLLLGSWLAAGASWKDLGESPLLQALMTHLQFKITGSLIHEVFPRLGQWECILERGFQRLGERPLSSWMPLVFERFFSDFAPQLLRPAWQGASVVPGRDGSKALPLQLQMGVHGPQARSSGQRPLFKGREISTIDKFFNSNMLERGTLFLKALLLWEGLSPVERKVDQGAWVRIYQQQSASWRRRIKENSPDALLPSPLSEKQLYDFLDTFSVLWKESVVSGQRSPVSAVFSWLKPRDALLWKNFFTTVFLIGDKGKVRDSSVLLPWMVQGMDSLEGLLWEYLDYPQVKESRRLEVLAFLEAEMEYLPVSKRGERFYKILQWAQGAQDPLLAQRAQKVVDRWVYKLPKEDLARALFELSTDFVRYYDRSQGNVSGLVLNWGTLLERLTATPRKEVVSQVVKFSRDPDARVRENARVWLRQVEAFFKNNSQYRTMVEGIRQELLRSEELERQADYVALSRLDKKMRQLIPVSRARRGSGFSEDIGKLWKSALRIQDPALLSDALRRLVSTLPWLTASERVAHVMPAIELYFSSPRQMTSQNQQYFYEINRSWMRVFGYFSPRVLQKIFRSIEIGLEDAQPANQALWESWIRVTASVGLDRFPEELQLHLWSLGSRDRETSEWAVDGLVSLYPRLQPKYKIDFWRYVSRGSFPEAPHFFESYFSTLYSRGIEPLLVSTDGQWLRPILWKLWQVFPHGKVSSPPTDWKAVLLGGKKSGLTKAQLEKLDQFLKILHDEAQGPELEASRRVLQGLWEEVRRQQSE